MASKETPAAPALRLSLDALRALDMIERCGSFAAAAEALHRSVSTLSYTVRQMELTLGVSLYDRSGHRAMLTAAGRVLLDDGRALLDAAAALQRRATRVGQGWEASLVIAFDELVPMQTVQAAVADFYGQGHPTRIGLRGELLHGAREALLAEHADVALMEVALARAEGVSYHAIGSVRFVFVVAPSHRLATQRQPLSPAVLRRARFVVAQDRAAMTRRLPSPEAVWSDALEVSSLNAKLQAQRAGLGVGFLPEWLVADDIRAGRLLALEVALPKPAVELAVAWRAQGAGPAANWFVERLRAADWAQALGG
jgi:DNA-binding transcriptional LysR family regulator